MKVGAVLETTVTAGGGFNQALNAIVQMDRLLKERHQFVVLASSEETCGYLAKLGIGARLFFPEWRDKLALASAGSVIGRRLQRLARVQGALENLLLAESVDLVYFVTPSWRAASLQRVNYMTTVWDLCHRDTPEFPEVRAEYVFQTRERVLRDTLGAAFLTLTDSDALANRLSFRYGLDRERLLAMPFAPSPFAAEKHAAPKDVVLRKYQLEEGYLFYPAQLWAHKNHVRILQAISELGRQAMRVRAVFAGGDQGNLAHLQAQARCHHVEGQVRFLGFVPAEDIRGLYQGSAAVVMPTYFGPTNLPPLEAWEIGRPLVYSQHLEEQVADAAVLVDPDDYRSVAQGIVDVLEADRAMKLVERGQVRLAALRAERTLAEERLMERLQQFASRRECWA